MEPTRRTPTLTVPITRFPRAVGNSDVYDVGADLGRRKTRNCDDRGIERWKETIREQHEDQTLLHQTVIKSKKQQLDIQLEKLAKQRAFIRQEKRKLLLQNAFLESEKGRFEASLTSDWFCMSAFPTEYERRITVDVGGHLFEISRRIATKDPMSLLAAFMSDESPLSSMECGCFRVDRDWWLFRYVLHFLRDGFLPQDAKLLRELYVESEFWQLGSLQKAIEMRNMEILQIKQSNASRPAVTSAPSPPSNTINTTFPTYSVLTNTPLGASHDTKSWWLDPPTWWGGDIKSVKSTEEAAAAAKKAKEDDAKKKAANDPDAWWRTTTYKGNDFTRVLNIDPYADPTKESRKDGEKSTKVSTERVPVMTSSTWQSGASHT